MIKEATCILRSNFLEVSKSVPELPASLSLPDFMKGQVEIPNCLRSFFTTLFCGKRSKKMIIPDSVKRKVESLYQDVIFCRSRARVKPPTSVINTLWLYMTMG